MSRRLPAGCAVILAAALVAMATAAVASPAANAAAIVGRESFSTYQFNQCAAGELIEITGTTLTVSRTVDEHTVFRSVFAGAQASAPSTGATYVALTQAGSASYAEPDGSPFVITIVQHVRFVRLGEDPSLPSGDDFDLRFLQHITTSPDGTTRTEFSDFELHCL